MCKRLSPGSPSKSREAHGGQVLPARSPALAGFGVPDPAEAPARAESQPDYPNIQRVSRPPPGADRWEWRQVIFAVVEATSKLAAIATGSAACSFLLDTTDAITECKLVDDYVDHPPEAVVAPWGQLPTATRIDSSAGQRLLR